jgi:hypothetical protein
LPRKAVGSGYQPLTLSVVALDSVPLVAATYQWFYKTRRMATTPTATADSLGDYKVLLTRQAKTCTASITLSAKPCVV